MNTLFNSLNMWQLVCSPHMYTQSRAVYLYLKWQQAECTLHYCNVRTSPISNWMSTPTICDTTFALTNTNKFDVVFLDQTPTFHGTLVYLRFWTPLDIIANKGHELSSQRVLPRANNRSERVSNVPMLCIECVRKVHWKAMHLNTKYSVTIFPDALVYKHYQA